MRLRLIVERHGLPPIQLLWNTEGLRTNHASSGPQTTVSQFLDQVNEVIPLEAGEWGFEDYVVEVNGFECLHFCKLSQIMKEEDVVTIRPLQIIDRRLRRVSGRDQISSDGKHLVDGVSFGRPLLRRPERPAIRIPPLKRARLIQDDNNNSNLPVPNQLFLTENTNIGEDDDDEYSGPEENEMENELQDLASESASVEYSSGNATQLSFSKSRKRSRSGLEINEGGTSTLLSDDGLHLVGEYNNPLLDDYYQDEPQHKTSASRPSRKSTYLTRSNIKSRHAKPQLNSRRSSKSSTKSVRFEGDLLETPATIRLSIESSDSEDQDFQPAESAASDTSNSDKENIEPGSDSTESSYDDDETSSSGSSEASESDSSEPSSSSSSSCGSTSGSDEHEVYTQEQPLPPLGKKLIPSKNEESRELDIAITSPPGEGMRKTQKRNARRRAKVRLERLKHAGVLPQDARLTDILEGADGDGGGVAPIDTDLPAKKQALLQAINSGGVDVQNDPPLLSPLKSSLGKESPTEEAMVVSERPEVSSSRKAKSPVTPDLERQHVTDRKPEEVQSMNLSTSETPQRRSKLDLASSRRLVFGSLGLRVPKTKDAGAKLREKLLENARSIPQIHEHDDALPQTTEPVNELDWKDKIILKAVECCYDNVVLSTPLFPFVQRWDPQQRTGNYHIQGAQNGLKSKKRKRNKKYHLEDYQNGEEYAGDDVHPTDEPTLVGQSDEQEETSVRPQNEDEYIRDAIDQQLFHDSKEQLQQSGKERNYGRQEGDLPELPEDISAQERFTLESATPGDVVAFRQIHMSEETRWAPEVSEYLTAVIDKILENGHLEMTLAYRDRVQVEGKFDDETGERLYAKFEMPGMEENDENLDGYIEISYDEMIEPKLIRSAQSTHDANSVVDTTPKQMAMPLYPNPPSEREVKSDVHLVPVFLDPPVVKLTSMPNNIESTPPDVNVTLEEAISSSKTKSRKPSELVMTDDARQEYSLLIKGAGFRSEIPSDIDRGFEDHVDIPKCDVTESPQFHGFDSDGPTHVRDNPTDQVPVVELSLEVLGSDGDAETANRSYIPSKSPEITRIRSATPVQDLAGENTSIAGFDHDVDKEPPVLDANDAVVERCVSSGSQAKRHVSTRASCVSFLTVLGDGDDEAEPSSQQLSMDGSNTHHVNVKQNKPTQTQQSQITENPVADISLDGIDNSDDTDEFPSLKKLLSKHQSQPHPRPAILDAGVDTLPFASTAPVERQPAKRERFRRLSDSNGSTRDAGRSFTVDDVLAPSSSSITSKELKEESDDGFVDYKLPAVKRAPPSKPSKDVQIVDLTVSSDPVDPEGSEYEEQPPTRQLAKKRAKNWNTTKGLGRFGRRRIRSDI